jgi:hypothetical protein
MCGKQEGTDEKERDVEDVERTQIERYPLPHERPYSHCDELSLSLRTPLTL